MKYRTLTYDELGETIYEYEHETGMKVLFVKKDGYKKKTAMFGTNYGSMDSVFKVKGQEIHVPDGIAHFLEHKLFEQEDGNMLDKFTSLGASPNAFTSFSQTVYYFSCTDLFEDNFRMLLDYVQNPWLTDENVEKEKGIIAQEIRMYEDNPYWRVYFNLLKGLYHKYPVRKDIAGTVESIYKINKEILYECYRTFYNPSNMVLFIAGDVDADRVVKQAEEIFARQPVEEAGGEIERIFPDEPKGVAQTRIEEKLAVSRPMFALGFKDQDITGGGDRLLEKIIANDIILDMLVGPSSDIYNSLYEEGLIDSSFGTDYTGERNYGHAIMSGLSSDPEKVTSVLYEEIDKRKSDSWDQGYFQRIKTKKTGQYIRLFNSLESVSIQFVSMLFRDINLFDYYKTIESMTYDYVVREFKQLYNRSNSCLSLILPKA